MAIYFGTDGIRGVVNDELTFNLAYNCGNALGDTKHNPTIIIGSDTRITASYLTLAFAGGAMSAGAKVVDVGVCPTAGIAYITKFVGADYGVVISASHNPAEYNGIKIFDSNGYKLGDRREEMLEKRFIHQKFQTFPNIGTYEQDFSLVNLYLNYLKTLSNGPLKGLKIVLDGSNGASHKVAPAVFRGLGAQVVATNCKNDGLKINKDCGSLHPKVLAKNVLKYGADLGLSFDGDSDRLIAVDENGRVVDGDMIVYVLAKYLKSKGKLKNNYVIGTSHTNMGIEESLKKEGINMLRTDVGDKYVLAKLLETKSSLGGEQSGHIILPEHSTTGDGILAGILLANVLKETGKKLSELVDCELYSQCNVNCVVVDKMHAINSEELIKAIDRYEDMLGEGSRIMVRVSGTEPKIRIMVECKDYDKAETTAKELEKIVKKIDEEVK